MRAIAPKSELGKKKAHWSSVHCKECSVALGGKLKSFRVPPLHLSKCDYCPTPNRFIYMNLSELILASLLKLLSNNDVEASGRSHAFFSQRVCLFVPSKVHSPLPRNNFPAVTLVLPTTERLLHITALDQRQPQKTGVTLTALSVFHWLTLAHGTVPQLIPSV